jgi:hypothetical protein
MTPIQYSRKVTSPQKKERERKEKEKDSKIFPFGKKRKRKSKEKIWRIFSIFNIELYGISHFDTRKGDSVSYPYRSGYDTDTR